MKLGVKNKNYCATVVKIEKIVPLEKMDNIVGAIIMNSHVIVSKNTEINSLGLFFPVETALSQEFLSNNNLFRDKTMNKNQEKGGFFENKGRIRCVKMGGKHISEGFFVPLDCLDYIDEKIKSNLKVGDEFDTIDENKICEKYIVRVSGSGKIQKGKSGQKAKKRESKLIDGLFRLHYDTAQLKKNLHQICASTLISISEKLHGTSLVVSNIPTKKKLRLREKIAKKLGVEVKDREHSLIYSSRTVIKNQYEKVNTEGFYKEDIWGEASKEIYPLLQKGMSAYAEIVGYLKSGSFIQKPFFYNCEPGTHKVYIYRITITDDDGKVIEMPFMQMKEYCEKMGLNCVPLVYYGRAIDYLQLDDKELTKFLIENKTDIYNLSEDEFRGFFLKKLEKDVQHKMCPYNGHKLPLEGRVIKIDGVNESTAFKYKNIDFLEFETKSLDKGEVDIESDTGEENEEQQDENKV